MKPGYLSKAYDECVLFFSNATNYQNLLKIVKSDNKDKERISLRTLDYFCKNYIQKNQHWIRQDGKSFRMLYHEKLKQYHKRNFDPFNRQSNQQPFLFQINPTDPIHFPPIKTTFAQLLYCKFLIETNIYSIVRQNLPAIQASMKKRNNQTK